MKIALLSGYNAIHTVRWANGLHESGHDVFLISIARNGENLSTGVKTFFLPFKPPFGYYLNAPILNYWLRKIRPDILHAHYASGYGTLGRLSTFHPYVLSVWGSDIYDFPVGSRLKSALIAKNLNSADMVCSTSRSMAKVIRQYYPEKPLKITPFGVNVDLFRPREKAITGTITIGTVKKLSDKYGIDILIRAFSRMRDMLRKNKSALAEKVRLLIVGDGPDRTALIHLARETGILDVTRFAGAIKYYQVPVYLNMMDIYAVFSRFESFGVAIIEASSCGLPVVVSDVDGPAEVVENEKTGLIAGKENVGQSADALMRLVINRSLREELGKMGRMHVVNNYNWVKSVENMESVYKQVMNS